MSDSNHRDPDPELEDIRQLGLIEHQHRKAARKLGVSHGTMAAIWLLIVAVLVVVLVGLFLAAR
ncbi:hypothetical protein Q8W71_26975 [Methylobacterium sp. NEAU 140]|uniref:hypothetical protein n=1 Tax=Methylobacterium sp. NEAU 140 TaxID=3064945 RepID=UPI002734AE2A|nr:hypothetical protein [Methylobacterium sp. NEAU 140]MDP4026275.1 hypothetical protein [Methylobacterium sp. NEAU 140]